MWTASFALACEAPSSAGVHPLRPPPFRAGTCGPHKDSSDFAGEEPVESTQEVSAAASGVGGLPADSRRTSSAELVCSSSLEAQLPVSRRGALCTGAAGFTEPLDVEGVLVAGGVNPEQLILSAQRMEPLPCCVQSRQVAETRGRYQRNAPRGNPAERYG